jgi:hypothetical protein
MTAVDGAAATVAQVAAATPSPAASAAVATPSPAAVPFSLIPLGDASAAACDGDSCALPA